MDYEITPEDVQAKLDRKDAFTLLDVREPQEWSVSHLNGAIHVPLQQVPQRLAEIPRDRDLVVYCRSGGRSAHAQRFLEANGYSRVRNLTGGMRAWQHEVDPSVPVA